VPKKQEEEGKPGGAQGGAGEGKQWEK
jgi:hypothetical protein